MKLFHAIIIIASQQQRQRGKNSMDRNNADRKNSSVQPGSKWIAGL